MRPRSYARPTPKAVFKNTSDYRISQHRHKPDLLILSIVLILLAIGLIVIYSIGPALSYQQGELSEHYYLIRQLSHIGIGILAFGVAASVPLAAWRRLTKPIVMSTIAANLLLLIPGIGLTIRGATRWINLGGITSFQPAELIKVALILLLADQLAARAKHELDDWRLTIKPSILILAAAGLLVVVFQRDLGTMLIISMIVLAMLTVAGLAWKKLSTIGGMMLGALAASILLFPHRVARFLTFLQPGSDTQGSGYQINQAKIAIGSGGWLGLGLGKSLQVYGYVPIAASDSIFAIFAEKFGFMGDIVLIGLFGILLWRLLNVATHAPDTYTRLLSAGVLIWLGSHIFINIGAMLAILPLTGVTLPFLSIGGTSLIFIMFGLGLVFQISAYKHYRVDTAFLKPLGDRVKRAV